MTINRRWIAREWLYLLAGFVWAYILFPIFAPPLARLVLWIFRLDPPPFAGLVPFIAFSPYVLWQVLRITMWVIRTLRETQYRFLIFPTRAFPG